MNQNELFSALLAGCPVAQVLFEVGEGGKLQGVSATRAAYESGLLVVDDVANHAAEEILRAESLYALDQGFRNALRLGERTSYEEFVDIDGCERWWMTTLAPLFDADGVPSHVIASFVDVDVLKRTELALKSLEASFRRLVEASSDAILVCVDGCVAHANDVAAKLFSCDQLVGRSLSELVRPSDAVVTIPLQMVDEQGVIVIVRR